MAKNFTVPEALMQQILNYTASRPYLEVWQMVEAIRALPAPIDLNEDIGKAASESVKLVESK